MSNIYPELAKCLICPRSCGINRYQETGYCGANANIRINLAQLHFGEEPVISGINGSGTIFFSHCNLRCVFCQNHTISWLGWGSIKTSEECISLMLDLQDKGAHNINLVTPSHYSIQLVDILHKAKQQGLKIPVVWNSNGFETVDILKRLEGLVDIYLPDFKYSSELNGKAYSDASDYPDIAQKAIKEMHRQVGDLVCDDNDIAQRGLIIRLLVLPDKIAGLTSTLRWIKQEIGRDTCISLLAQYYPTWKAKEHPSLNRGITQNEYDEVLLIMDTLGLHNGFKQELSCSSDWTPDFTEQSLTKH